LIGIRLRDRPLPGAQIPFRQPEAGAANAGRKGKSMLDSLYTAESLYRQPLVSPAARPPRCGSATDRALAAYALIGKTIGPVNQRQAAILAGASLSYVVAICVMTPAERAAVREGRLRLTDYVDQRWHSAANAEDLVAKLGPDRVLAALDRMTAPPAEDGPAACNGAVASNHHA
jgi:hypothetical protein